MRAPKHPWVIILTKFHRGMVIMMDKYRAYCDLSTASEVFLILLPF